MEHETNRSLLVFNSNDQRLLGGVSSPLSDKMAAGLHGIAVNALLFHQAEITSYSSLRSGDTARTQLNPSDLVSDRNKLVVLVGELAAAKEYVSARDQQPAR